MSEILRLSPQPSRRLAAFVVISHLLALAVVLVLPLSFLPQVILLLMVAFSLWHAWHASVIAVRDRSIKTAEWDGGDEWYLIMADGRKSSARLLGSSYVQPWLLVLNFASEKFGRCRLIILPDSVDGELLRRLRVRLKGL